MSKHPKTDTRLLLAAPPALAPCRADDLEDLPPAPELAREYEVARLRARFESKRLNMTPVPAPFNPLPEALHLRSCMLRALLRQERDHRGVGRLAFDLAATLRALDVATRHGSQRDAVVQEIDAASRRQIAALLAREFPGAPLAALLGQPDDLLLIS